MRRAVRLFAFWGAIVLAMHAQAQSPLSVNYPFGLPVNSGSAKALNMGNAATAVLDDENILLGNPANLGGIAKTAFSSVLDFDFLRPSQSGDHANYLTVAPREISFAFPLGKAGTLGVAVAKETDAEIKYRTDPTPIPGTDFDGRLSYDREGGLTGWQGGWGRQFGKWLYVGASYERLFLNINSTKIVDLADYEATSTRDSVRVQFHGNALRAGLIATLANATLGVCGRYVFNGDAQYERVQYRWAELSSIPGTDIQQTAPFRMPPSASAGLSYQFNPALLAAADVGTDRWDRFSSGGILPQGALDYTLNFGGGVQLIPAPDVLAPKYWETVHYRLGLDYAQLPASDNAEYALSLGAGLPLGGGGLFDIVARLGRRTSAAFSNYTEDFLTIAIGINGGRKWAKSPTGTY